MEKKDNRLAVLLGMSRVNAGLSQEHMALELEVSRKTIQNWERGTSEPSIGQALEWFRVVDSNPLPYFFAYAYPNMDNLKPSDDYKNLKKSLNILIDALPEEGVRQLLYLFYGNHGSSPRAVLNMVTAHLQSPMKDRVSNGELILKNYMIAAKRGELSNQLHIQPDVSLLRRAIDEGEGAAVRNASGYSLSRSEEYFLNEI